MSSPDASASAPSSSPACVPLAEEERREHLQVDHVGEGGEGDERRAVEMSVAVVEQEGGGWSEDSDPDSPASEPREGCGNGFTSDSDSDSTISTTSGSDSDEEDREKDRKRKKKKSSSSAAPKRRFSNEFPRKRPLLIEELHPDQHSEEAKRSRDNGGQEGP